MRGQTHKYSSGMMRPSQPTAEQKYSQEYGEASGKMVAPTQRDPLLKNLATIASQKGGLKSYLMAWHQLEHLKTGKAPTLDSKQLEKLKEQYDAFTGKDKKQSSEGKSKGRRTQKDPNENKQVG
jgi:hypothetical protein